MDIAFKPIRVVATSSTNILIEVARIEQIRPGGQPSVVHVGDGLRRSARAYSSGQGCISSRRRKLRALPET